VVRRRNLRIFFTRKILFLVFLFGAGPLKQNVFALEKEKECLQLLIRFLNNASIRAGTKQADLLRKALPTFDISLPTTSDRLRIGTINTYNLYLTRGRWVKEVDPATGMSHSVRKTDPQTKEIAHTAEFGRIILENDLDLVILNEVEVASSDGGLNSITRFVKDHLHLRYIPFWVSSNDRREISTVCLVKAGLQFDIDFDSNVFRSQTVRTLSDLKEILIFARDLPILYLRKKGAPPDSKPALVLLGAHFKSKRDAPNDPGSRNFRLRELSETQAIVGDIRRTWGEDTLIILGGDMNSSLFTDNDLLEATARIGLVNSVKILDPEAKEGDYITHVFFPDRESNVRVINQMDGFFLSYDLQARLRQSKVIPYHDEQGNPRPIPQSIKDRKMQPSDHRPFMIEIDMQGL
jgi:hypothetical protein